MTLCGFEYSSHKTVLQFFVKILLYNNFIILKKLNNMILKANNHARYCAILAI